MIHKTVSFCSSYKCVVGVTKTHFTHMHANYLNGRHHGRELEL